MASHDWSGELVQYLKLGSSPSADLGALLAAIGGSVQAAVEREIGRHLDVQSHTEAYDGNGRTTLYLRNDPVISVTSLSVSGSTITVDTTPTYPPSTVVIVPGGIAYTTGDVFQKGYGNVLITYTAGYNIMPEDIRQAIVSWSALIFKDRDRSGLASEGVGGQSTSFVREIPPFAKSVILKHARWGKPC